jgi:FixJ family two-component response regulator
MNSEKYIFLVEDDDDLRSDLERALKFCDYTIFAFADPEQFLLEFKPVVPAILVTDMRMPKLSGIQLQSKLIAKGYPIPIIFISGESLDEQIVKAFKNGAFDFLLKPFSREDFLSAVAKAIEQDSVAMHEVIRKSQLAQALKTLSPRERQVFALLVKGYGNQELVDELGVALSTAKEYKSEVMYKLRLRSLAELISFNTDLLGN